MFVQHLEIPIMLPVKDFGHYQSGLVRLGNVDIEFLSIGTDQPSEPVFYGIALTSNLDVWETARWLKVGKIEHSLPVKACAIQRNQPYCWTVTLFKGFLANPLKAPYSFMFICWRQYFSSYSFINSQYFNAFSFSPCCIC